MTKKKEKVKVKKVNLDGYDQVDFISKDITIRIKTENVIHLLAYLSSKDDIDRKFSSARDKYLESQSKHLERMDDIDRKINKHKLFKELLILGSSVFSVMILAQAIFSYLK